MLFKKGAVPCLSYFMSYLNLRVVIIIRYLICIFSFEQLCPSLPIQLQKKDKQEISYKLSCFQVPG